MTTESEILYGFHPVGEALAARRRTVLEIIVDSTRTSLRLEPLLQMARKRNIVVGQRSTRDIRSLCRSDQHQGIAARVSPLPLLTLDQLLAESRARQPFILVLDQIADPRNLGAIIRTAVCAGVDGVVIPQDRSAQPNPTVSKASAGALEHVRLVRVANLARTAGQLKDAGLWVAGLDREGAVDLYTADFGLGAVAMVIGGEEKGIRPLIRKNCDFIVSIEQVGPITSLNASVAAAVAIYEVVRQRKMTKGVNQTGKV